MLCMFTGDKLTYRDESFLYISCSLFYYILGMWIFITLLPLLVLNDKKQDQPICTRDYAGWTLWGIGFLFEVIADYQKSVFKANPDNAVSYTSMLCFMFVWMEKIF